MCVCVCVQAAGAAPDTWRPFSEGVSLLSSPRGVNLMGLLNADNIMGLLKRQQVFLYIFITDWRFSDFCSWEIETKRSSGWRWSRWCSVSVLDWGPLLLWLFEIQTCKQAYKTRNFASFGRLSTSSPCSTSVLLRLRLLCLQMIGNAKGFCKAKRNVNTCFWIILHVEDLGFLFLFLHHLKIKTSKAKHVCFSVTGGFRSTNSCQCFTHTWRRSWFHSD